jgi:uncharacterized protein (TIGR02118 family)
MIVAISLIRRRADLTSEAFRRHWLDPHGVLTATLPGTRSYVQGHVIDHPAMNAAARRAGIDGFAVLGFDSIADRALAYASPVIRACNIDSEQFIGAVRRLVTEPRIVLAPPAGGAARKIYLLGFGDPAGMDAWARAVEAAVPDLPGARGLVCHAVLSQHAPPESRIPDLGLTVAGFAEIWLADDATLGAGAAALGATGAEGVETAVFVAEDHRLI